MKNPDQPRLGRGAVRVQHSRSSLHAHRVCSSSVLRSVDRATTTAQAAAMPPSTHGLLAQPTPRRCPRSRPVRHSRGAAEWKKKRGSAQPGAVGMGKRVALGDAAAGCKAGPQAAALVARRVYETGGEQTSLVTRDENMQEFSQAQQLLTVQGVQQVEILGAARGDEAAYREKVGGKEKV